MSHRFLNINSIEYESENDIITLNFSACRFGNSAILNGFSEPIEVPIDTYKTDQNYSFSIILDASTASITDTTTFITSTTQLFFQDDFKISDNINFKLMGQFLLSRSGYTFSEEVDLIDGLNILVENMNFVGNISEFSASVKDSSILISAPDKTGVYYNGFTVQSIINNSMKESIFSGGSTTYELSFGYSKYNLTI
jgi:hypothetical protein